MEHFQWKNDDQIREVLANDDKRARIGDELADVMIYCLGLSDVLSLDVYDAIVRKIHKNGQKYPISGPTLPA